MCKVFKVGCGEENTPVDNSTLPPLNNPPKRHSKKHIFPC